MSLYQKMEKMLEDFFEAEERQDNQRVAELSGKIRQMYNWLSLQEQKKLRNEYGDLYFLKIPHKKR